MRTILNSSLRQLTFYYLYPFTNPYKIHSMNLKKSSYVTASFLSIGSALFFACVRTVIPIPPPIHHDSIPPTDTTANDSVNLKNGLLLYLSFNGTMADSSGNNNPTVDSNATLGTDAHGNANSAFVSNGTGQFLFVTNNGSIKFDTAYSFSLDVMPATASQQMYLSMVNWSNGNGPSWNIGTSFPYDYTLDLGISDSTAGCDNSGATDPNRVVDSTGFTPQATTWYNLTVTYRYGVIKVYVNGSLISTRTSTGNTALLCPLSSVIVGGWWSGDPENFNGKIDEVRLYNRVLTPAEINLLAQNL
jgi:Concanavalin A-like lectin/glucanases superfamily